jgi:hypothetical protein
METKAFACYTNCRRFSHLVDVESGKGLMVMKCPLCGIEMEDGYFQSMLRAAWVKKPHKVSLMPKQGEILLENNFASDCVFAASICKSCKKLIIDYSDKDAILGK